MENWVLVFKKSDLPHLAAVRCWPGLYAAETETEVWLRCPLLHADLDQPLRALPAMHTYRQDAQGLLFPLSGSTPVSKLPALDWLPMQQFIPIELPGSALPAQLTQQYALRLLPSMEYHSGAALKLKLDDWQTYADTAPEIRLSALRFALSAAGDVLVMGEPLPPLPGEEYWLRESILLPAAYDLEWPLLAQLFNQQENSKGMHFLLFEKDGNWQKIEKQCFVPATRAGIRQRNIKS
ncbi:hypothetical protein [Haliscomenobacter sp.]|uniref:hypothetical protein n=1 Tax=Haliscomenobacter sp. TaxID=2717303 RepID=UPI0035938F13